jgi:very-short-patch-repair endonuclease
LWERVPSEARRVRGPWAEILAIIRFQDGFAATRKISDAGQQMLKKRCGICSAGRRLSKAKFRRQAPFRNYILDFVCFERRVVVEIDGSQHLDSERDKERDSLLASEGFQVIRYWNNDVLQRRTAVLEDLFAKLQLDKD